MAPTPGKDEALTRDRLLQLLRYRPRTIEELAATVGLTANGVRAQVVLLERDGLIHRIGVRRGEGPGKPPALYGVTAQAEAAFSAAYAPALGALVAVLDERLPRARLRAVFHAAGRRLGAAADTPTADDPADAARVLLESLGAAATVHRAQGRATVEGVACPLAQAVRRCPDSCELVRTMLATVTGARVATRCEHGEAPRCRFTID